jgi:hypothetical protein
MVKNLPPRWGRRHASHKVIVALTVKEILDEQIVKKLA